MITSSQQSFIWKGFGLKLNVQQDSLPAGIEECRINIKASIAGQYEFPENLHLVSAVFWLRCEPMCKFTQPLSLEIQQCAKQDNTSKLYFMRALCSQESLPYTFKQLKTGSHFHQYSILQLKSFSGVAVAQEGSEEREYVARLFYLSQSIYTYDIHLVVTWNIEAHLSVSRSLWFMLGLCLECIVIHRLPSKSINRVHLVLNNILTLIQMKLS